MPDGEFISRAGINNDGMDTFSQIDVELVRGDANMTLWNEFKSFSLLSNSLGFFQVVILLNFIEIDEKNASKANSGRTSEPVGRTE